MNNKRTKDIFSILFKQFCVSIFMFLIGISIIIYAHGYKINYKTLKFVKTGIISLSSEQKTADVYVDNKLVSQKTPYSNTYMPGYYQAEIRKEGYASWFARINVLPEMVSSYKNIVLFKNNIVPEELTNDKEIAHLSVPNEELATGGLTSLVQNEFEIWNGNALVARFSEPILKAIWYPDRYHIIYQQKNQIRVIETSGSNDTLLVSLASTNPSNIAVDSKGFEIYYFDAGRYMVAKIK